MEAIVKRLMENHRVDEEISVSEIFEPISKSMRRVGDLYSDTFYSGVIKNKKLVTQAINLLTSGSLSVSYLGHTRNGGPRYAGGDDYYFFKDNSGTLGVLKFCTRNQRDPHHPNGGYKDYSWYVYLGEKAEDEAIKMGFKGDN